MTWTQLCGPPPKYPHQPYNGNRKCTRARGAAADQRQGRWQNSLPSTATTWHPGARWDPIVAGPAAPLRATGLAALSPNRPTLAGEDGIFYWTGKGLKGRLRYHRVRQTRFARSPAIRTHGFDNSFGNLGRAWSLFVVCVGSMYPFQKAGPGWRVGGRPRRLVGEYLDANLFWNGAWYAAAPIGPDAIRCSLPRVPTGSTPPRQIANLGIGEGAFTYVPPIRTGAHQKYYFPGRHVDDDVGRRANCHRRIELKSEESPQLRSQITSRSLLHARELAGLHLLGWRAGRLRPATGTTSCGGVRGRHARRPTGRRGANSCDAHRWSPVSTAGCPCVLIQAPARV